MKTTTKMEWMSSGHYEDDEPSGGCCSGGTGCRWRVLVRHGLMALVGVVMYVAVIAADVNAAAADHRNGHSAYAVATVLLVFAPSLLLSLYMFVTSLVSYTGLLAGCRAVTWVLLMPVMPLWPVVRGLIQIYHAVAAACCSRYISENQLQKPTSAHLLKFLQAFACSAPQLVLRLHKLIATEKENPFSSMSVAEAAQVALSMLLLSFTVVSTYNKEVSTKQVLQGEVALEKLSCGAGLIALVWWFSFLAARIPCIALFIYYFEYWTVVLLLLHCLMLFTMQSFVGRHNLLRRAGVYLFSGFIFIFAYLQVNMSSRIDSFWVPYLLFSCLALVEQTAMLTCWILVRKNIIPYFPLLPSMASESVNATQGLLSPTSLNAEFSSTSASPDRLTYLGVLGHDELLLTVHYVLFAVAMIFMAVTFCCAWKRSKNTDDDE